MSNALENLPPEMQARLAQIMAQAQGNPPAAQSPAPATAAPAQEQGPAPAPKPPSLMDHVISLRQEVAAMRQEVHAVAQVSDAVGQAVGQLYATFLETTAPTNQSPTYSESFQNSVEDSDY